jgi:flavin reductase (DIM6/NTAB) family NADH-FMN oxidoreductase RutF
MNAVMRVHMPVQGPLAMPDAFASGCVMISVRGEKGRPRAVRALAFNSVSLSPAIVVWVLRKEDAETVRVGHACGVSVLAQADSGEVPGAPLLNWQPGEVLGVPLAMDSLAGFEAVVFDCMDRGDEVVQFAQLASFCRGTVEVGCVDFGGKLQPSHPL